MVLYKALLEKTNVRGAPLNERFISNGIFLTETYTRTVQYDVNDGAILAPTVTSLRIMLKICDEFGKKFDVLFNPDMYLL